MDSPVARVDVEGGMSGELHPLSGKVVGVRRDAWRRGALLPDLAEESERFDEVRSS